LRHNGDNPPPPAQAVEDDVDEAARVPVIRDEEVVEFFGAQGDAAGLRGCAPRRRTAIMAARFGESAGWIG
jgi:hypothetical protein